MAVREFELPSGPCDYLLFIDRKAAGAIEAKPQGMTLVKMASPKLTLSGNTEAIEARYHGIEQN